MSVMLRVKIFNESLVLRPDLEAIVETEVIRFLYLPLPTVFCGLALRILNVNV